MSCGLLCGVYTVASLVYISFFWLVTNYSNILFFKFLSSCGIILDLLHVLNCDPESGIWRLPWYTYPFFDWLSIPVTYCSWNFFLVVALYWICFMCWIAIQNLESGGGLGGSFQRGGEKKKKKQDFNFFFSPPPPFIILFDDKRMRDLK